MKFNLNDRFNNSKKSALSDCLEFEHQFRNSQISGGSFGGFYMIYRCDYP